MVKFAASLIGAATVFARVTSAFPMDYGAPAASSSSAPPSYQTAAAYNSPGSYSAPPSWQTASAQYGSSSSSSAPPSYQTASQYSSGMSSPPSSYSPSSYGSGSVNWNSGSYDGCVQQCVAQFGSPSMMYTPPSTTSDAGSSGSGTTHTVWVAPTQGVLRYVPFAVNASVGDTVKFIWGANVHTVTKSSELDICNKTGDSPFASGVQNKTFVFTQVVNDTNPTFYYCGVPTHCQKGMFGILNPPNAFGQPSSAGMMMPNLTTENPSTQAAWSYMTNATAGQPAAAAWGDSMDLSNMPGWAQSYAAENILFTKSFLALNPETIQAGSVDLSPLNNNPIMMPTDVAATVRANNADNSTSTSAAPSTSTTSASGKNGAGALSSPRVAVGLVAVAAALFAL